MFRVALFIALSLVCNLNLQAAEKTPNYMPHNKGAKWTYNMTVNDKKATVANEVTDIEKKDDQEIFVMSMTFNEKVIGTEHMSQTKEGVFRHKVGPADLSPPLQLLKYPIKDQEWESENESGGVKSSYKMKSTEEEIEVPAGKFNAVKVVLDTDVDGQKVNGTYWLVENIGIVKQELITGPTTIRLELDKYETGK